MSDNNNPSNEPILKVRIPSAAFATASRVVYAPFVKVVARGYGYVEVAAPAGDLERFGADLLAAAYRLHPIESRIEIAKLRLVASRVEVVLSVPAR